MAVSLFEAALMTAKWDRRRGFDLNSLNLICQILYHIYARIDDISGLM